MTVSKLQIMRALLGKDWRFFRVPMIALLIIGAGCYLIAFVEMPRQWPAPRYNHRLNLDPGLFITAAECGIAFTILMCAVFGGIAIADERADRTADFIALLPVTRGQIILSKWLVSLFMLGGCAIGHAAFAFWIYWFWGPDLPKVPWFPITFNAVACTLSLFGVAWLLSCFISSGPLSACIAIGITLGIALLAGLAMEANYHAGYYGQVATGVAPWVIGFLSILTGTVNYIRRVAP